MDEALIARYLKEGRGTGLGADYKPWLKIYDVPSLGRSHRLRGIKTGRVHHFLSDIEVSLFYLLDWHDAVLDIREQFPLDREETQAIAERAGIKYPVDSQTRVPLVQTTDFLVDYVVAGEHRRIAYAVKPVEALSEKRKAELLELERLYWLARGIQPDDRRALYRFGRTVLGGGDDGLGQCSRAQGRILPTLRDRDRGSRLAVRRHARPVARRPWRNGRGHGGNADQDLAGQR
ncbi:TnsA endonuclease N-terminal domain-containing protein [Magnetospirillum sulfuroxidans]|uniref:TnsA endonuclease N-terminal domain-containing protein n=1 Tax=Magnetospirillum sulfuroxidans TaxID=611300 RepID=UPI0031FF0B2C